MTLFPTNGRALARAVACALGAACLPLHAADGPDDPQHATTLREVRVSAAGRGAPVDPDLPAAVETITAEQLDRFNVINAEDALKYLPSFGIRKRFTGDENATFSVRGTSNQQSARGLVYLDGLLLSNLLGNNWANPPRWSMAFPENLSRVDVIYGAYSALYPGNAIGATVLMTTRMPEKLEVTGDVQAFTQHVHTYGVDRDYGGSRQTATIGDRDGRFAFLIGVSHLQANGQPLVYGTQNRSTVAGARNPVTGAIGDTGATGVPREVLGINSEGQEASSQDEAHARLTYDVTPDLTAALTAGYWKQDLSHRTETFLRDANGQPVWSGPVTIDGRQYTVPANFFAPSTRQSRNYLYGISLGTHRDSGWNIEGDASYFDMDRNRDRVANAVTDNGAGLLTAGDGSRWRTFDLRASHTPDNLGPHTHTVSFGYHFDGYALDNATYNLANWRNGEAGSLTTANGGSTQTQAVYLQDAWQLIERWRLTVGARYEQWRAFGGSRSTSTATVGYPERKESHTSPKASLAYDASDTVTLRLSGARAYRFPTVNELFQGTFNGIALINNDPNLKPEKDLSREFSTEWYRPNGVARFTIYRSDTRNTLFSQTDTTVFPNVTSVQNVGLVRTRGAEASYDGTGVWWPMFDLTANAAYTQATTVSNARNPTSEGKQFYRIPRWRANVIGTYHASERVALTLAGRYSGRQYNTLDHSDIHPDTFGGASAFLTFDAKLTWKVSDHVELGAGVDNLTNRRYYVYYPYPSRSYLVEAKFRL
ncbi:ligand-gated channel protein [Luteibacter rhizovicinus DSM 16549]|uniref:Ligand-gated channel protein n=1 Tax=Luteibacter rhizovicinus DSM 16549 TaxID=1440763 RepID=A0A0G9HH15_9GAMM|nr:TonB-dependent receptor [Luteibacter rhizovicinus]APG03592.1 ligand-gated channel protein [Luteibacter rhizovicinus DSM 16549]KLD68756.1 ligand-gated channel protein [Luteibacter rhizovicinus DSM 16549]KLD76412.1 ligand-gated channel protein [Xanthomonas hyacinthi DSM 19077]